VCKDIAFCDLRYVHEKTSINPVADEVKMYKDKMFSNGMDFTTYNHFLFSYYSRLSNIDEQQIDVWMSKIRRIKGKIIQTSSYCRNLAALKIQKLVRNCIIRNKFARLNLIRIQRKKIEESKQRKRDFDNSVFQQYLEHRSSKTIVKFFKNALEHKRNSYLREELKALKKDKKDNNLLKLTSKINHKRYDRLTIMQKEFQSSSQSNIFEYKSHIKLSHTYNNKDRWFGFHRNDCLNNLVIASGFDVALLEIKLKYSFTEFMEVLKCLAEICSSTKTFQFVKLCRSLSGNTHKDNTIRDFIQGFCWMFKSVNKGRFLQMVQLFCKSTNNHKFMLYVTNNVDAIIKKNVNLFNLS
jgi:hypothetical protein